MYEQEARALLRFFARRVWDAQTALDLTAETFAAAYASRRSCRAETIDDAVHWLYGIARHELSRFFRRGRVEHRALERLAIDLPVADDQELRRVEDVADLPALRADLSRAIDTLPASQRDAVLLKVVHELSYPEVAARLQVTEPNARARVSRGLRTLASSPVLAHLMETR